MSINQKYKFNKVILIPTLKLIFNYFNSCSVSREKINVISKGVVREFSVFFQILKLTFDSFFRSFFFIKIILFVI